jgi:hypothetical protein
MAEVVDRGRSRERFVLVLMGAFAVIALALAALGLYGVLAYAVRQRSTEIGIRIALGATAGQVRAPVFRQAAVVVSLGVAAGLAGALVLGRWLEALAFGIAASDPRILMGSRLAQPPAACRSRSSPSYDIVASSLYVACRRRTSRHNQTRRQCRWAASACACHGRTTQTPWSSSPGEIGVVYRA